MNKGLRITLYAIGVYFLVLGTLFLFLPRTAEATFGISLPDTALTMLYGQVVLTFAYFAYRISKSDEYAKLYAVLVALFGGHILVFLYQIFTGVATIAQVGPPLGASLIFTILLLIFGRK